MTNRRISSIYRHHTETHLHQYQYQRYYLACSSRYWCYSNSTLLKSTWPSYKTLNFKNSCVDRKHSYTSKNTKRKRQYHDRNIDFAAHFQYQAFDHRKSRSPLYNRTRSYQGNQSQYRPSQNYSHDQQ